MTNAYPLSFVTAFDSWMNKAQDIVKSSTLFRGEGTLTAKHGRRYVKIVMNRGGQQCAHAFIDTTNGNVLKPDGWEKPSPIPRGNIYGDRLGVNEYGAKYLR